jgi:mannose-6-phosphate isomerase-like protein (cupin superfamily)
MALFVSVIEAGGSVTGHYHEHSSEDYHIVDGEGIIATLPAEELGSLASPEKVKIKAGMSFSVSARCVHRLFNNSSKPLTFLFHCPLNHLSTDRIIVPNFAD